METLCECIYIAAVLFNFHFNLILGWRIFINMNDGSISKAGIHRPIRIFIDFICFYFCSRYQDSCAEDIYVALPEDGQRISGKLANNFCI